MSWKVVAVRTQQCLSGDPPGARLLSLATTISLECQIFAQGTQRNREVKLLPPIPERACVSPGFPVGQSLPTSSFYPPPPPLWLFKLQGLRYRLWFSEAEPWRPSTVSVLPVQCRLSGSTHNLSARLPQFVQLVDLASGDLRL